MVQLTLVQAHQGLFIRFSHDRTIKRFTPIGFGFATCIGFVHFTSAFFRYFLGSLGLIILQGLGDPIAGLANPHNQARRDTPHLTIGPTPLSFGRWATSGRGALAFTSRSHSASTSATHGTRTLGGRKLFSYLFFFTSVDPVLALGHGRVLDVVERVADFGWTFGWRCGVRKVALPHPRRPWSLYWYA